MWAEENSLRACLLFYNIPRVVLAPNQDLLQLLGRDTGKPAFLMSRGVDIDLFSPTKRSKSDAIVSVGYVGRLSPEKNVRLLPDIEQALAADAGPPVRFTIVGEGCEREWLHRNLRRATFTGVLRGEALASAYADMDVFAFPSETETFGNVVLEAMASGVPVVAMARGGPMSLAGSGPSPILARDPSEYVEAVRALVSDIARRRVMSDAGRARALQMSWDHIFDAVYRAYAEAVRLAQRPPSGALGDSLIARADA